MIKAFPKIFALGTDYIADILDGEVEVTEKIDGSQFAFGLVDNELYLRSKGATLFADAPNKMFKEAVDYVVSIKDRLPQDVIFHAECLQNPKHNTLKYGRIPKNHIMLFSVSNLAEKFSTYKEIETWAKTFDIEAVPLLYKGKIANTDEIQAFLKQKSILGEADIEGVVVKNYNKPFLLGGQPIPLMSGKYVSEAFKEVHRKIWTGENTVRGKWDTFKLGFKTEARWEKAIQYLRDKGELEESPRDIGKLIKRIMEDIQEEEKEYIKTFLWKEFGGEVMQTAARGFPEYYKLKLLKKLDK